MSLDLRLQGIWYGRPGMVLLPLLPLSWLFGSIVRMRRWAFRQGLLKTLSVERPVIVVGNITVGGTGKTPLVIWLANALAAQAYKVGVITRGYGGKASSWPQRVRPDSHPEQVGDEAVLIAQQTQALVFAGPDRVASARQAIAAGAELIISDDGLQHYRLRRDCELVVVDASRMLGNGHVLPAGPLREFASRLKEADCVLLNRRGEHSASKLDTPALEFRVVLTELRQLTTGEVRPLDAFKGKRAHLVTGIGNPQGFVGALRACGIEADARILPDHAAFAAADLEFADDLPVLMTEKDAVKCRRFADHRHWAVGAEARFDSAAAQGLLDCVRQSITRRSTGKLATQE